MPLVLHVLLHMGQVDASLTSEVLARGSVFFIFMLKPDSLETTRRPSKIAKAVMETRSDYSRPQGKRLTATMKYQ